MWMGLVEHVRDCELSRAASALGWPRLFERKIKSRYARRGKLARLTDPSLLDGLTWRPRAPGSI